jgi:hypothetical protein
LNSLSWRSGRIRRGLRVADKREHLFHELLSICGPHPEIQVSHYDRPWDKQIELTILQKISERFNANSLQFLRGFVPLK